MSTDEANEILKLQNFKHKAQLKELRKKLKDAVEKNAELRRDYKKFFDRNWDDKKENEELRHRVKKLESYYPHSLGQLEEFIHKDDKLKEFLLMHETEIAQEVEAFGLLKATFLEIIGRDAIK